MDDADASRRRFLLGSTATVAVTVGLLPTGRLLSDVTLANGFIGRSTYTATLPTSLLDCLKWMHARTAEDWALDD